MTLDEKTYLLWLAAPVLCAGAGMYIGKEYARVHDACITSARKIGNSLETFACSLVVPALTTVLLQQSNYENAVPYGIVNWTMGLATLRWWWQDWQTDHTLSSEEKNKLQSYHLSLIHI